MNRQEMREHCNAYGYSDEEVGAFLDGYQLGRADQKEEDNAFFNFEGAWELEKKKVRADAIDECIAELEEDYKRASENTKYPEYDAYCNGIEDCIEYLEQLKEQNNDV